MTFSSSDFPILNPVAPRPDYNFSDDAFILKLSPDGSSLIYSTTIGGVETDQGNAIAVDSGGSAYVTGQTNSGDFPVRSALQPISGSPPSHCGIFGCQTVADAFVVKLAPNGSLVYSTYRGGSGVDMGYGIATDSSGNAYVTGQTDSPDFPLRAGGYITACAPVPNLPCATSGFVAKLNSAGNALVYSTLIAHGGTRGMAIAVDSSQSAYITGSGLLQVTIPSDPCDNCSFVAKLSQDGTALLYSATINDADMRALTLDSEGNSYAAGYALGDAIAVRISKTGGPPFRTYLGPGDGSGVATNPSGAMIVAGYGLQGSFPTTPGAVQTSICGADLDYFCGYLFVAGMDVISQPPLSTPQFYPGGLVNAASLEFGLPAPGEIITAFGSGFGPPGLVIGQPDSLGRLPRSLAGTSILFSGSQAPLLYVAPNQLSAIVPYGVANSTAVSIVIDDQGVRSQPQAWSLGVAGAAPAIFTQNQSGSGPGAILNQDLRLNTVQNPAALGSIIMIYGTGEGATDPQGIEGIVNHDPAPIPKLPVRVRIGGVDAEVLYAGGVAGQVPGLLQVNARIPANVLVGQVPVELLVGSFASSSRTTVFVGPPPP